MASFLRQIFCHNIHARSRSAREVVSRWNDGRASLLGGGRVAAALLDAFAPSAALVLVPEVRLLVVAAERNLEIDPARERAELGVRQAGRVPLVQLPREQQARARATRERRQGVGTDPELTQLSILWSGAADQDVLSSPRRFACVNAR